MHLAADARIALQGATVAEDGGALVAGRVLWLSAG
jgi:hypothetical protein